MPVATLGTNDSSTHEKAPQPNSTCNNSCCDTNTCVQSVFPIYFAEQKFIRLSSYSNRNSSLHCTAGGTYRTSGKLSLTGLPSCGDLCHGSDDEALLVSAEVDDDAQHLCHVMSYHGMSSQQATKAKKYRRTYVYQDKIV